MEHNNIGLISRSLKIWRAKLLKIAGSDHLTVIWGPLATEPIQISAWTLYCPKVESMGYIFADDGMGLPSFKFLQW